MTNYAFQNGKMVYILDTKGEDALILMPEGYKSYVIAHNYTVNKHNDISWAYGKYYGDLEDAANMFYKNSYKAYLRRWQYIHDLNRSDIFCYGVATSEDGNFKVVFEDNEQRKNYEDLFGEV